MSEKTAAEWLVQQLKLWGTRSIYGVSGDAILPFIDAIGQDSQVRFYSVKHESTAALMASAEAKLLGRLGVCTATSGPGAANLINGLADAKSDRAPVLAITGQVANFDLNTDDKQTIDQNLLLKPAVAYSGLVTTPKSLNDILLKAMRLAIRDGSTTHINITKDVWSQKVVDPLREYEPYLTNHPQSDFSVIDRAVELMNKSKKPAILVGRGISHHGGDLIQLAERWQSGVTLTMPAKGRIPGNFPLVMGGLGEGGSEASTTMLAEADLILIAGATWWPKKYFSNLSAQIIQIDIDPINIGGSSPIDYGVVGDLGFLLPQITHRLAYKDRTEWVKRLQSLRKDWENRIRMEYSQNGGPISPAYLIKTIEEVAASDAIIALDVGDHTVWFNRIFNGSNQEILVSGNWRTMGFGLPAALSAKINCPEKQVIALVGDGGFVQNLADFLTAVRYQLPITVLVVNNGYLAMEKDKMELKGMNGELMSVTNPNFAQFAEICGGKGYSINHSEQLKTVLQEAIDTPAPTILDIKTDVPIFPGNAETVGTAKG